MDNCQKYDKVVVRELSRFGRDLQSLLQDIEKLEDAECDFISVRDEQIDTSTAQGQLLFNIIASFNQFWSDLAQERTEEMIQRRREEGKPIGRPKKLSDEQIEHLKEIRKEHDYSYQTLTAIAEQKWGVEVTRQTMSRYMKETEQ
jgi:DNA invertase Pin-like site-specific DNA recombinase